MKRQRQPQPSKSTLIPADARKTKVGYLLSHRGCGGWVMVGATALYRPVSGAGERGARFLIERERAPKRWRGACVKCDTQGLFCTDKALALLEE